MPGALSAIFAGLRRRKDRRFKNRSQIFLALALLPPAFCSFLAAAARASALFSAFVCFALGSQLPFSPADLPGVGL